MQSDEEEEGFYRFPVGKNGHVVAPEAVACSTTTVYDLASLFHPPLHRVASRCTADSLQHLVARSMSRVVTRYCALFNLTPVIVP